MSIPSRLRTCSDPRTHCMSQVTITRLRSSSGRSPCFRALLSIVSLFRESQQRVVVHTNRWVGGWLGGCVVGATPKTRSRKNAIGCSCAAVYTNMTLGRRKHNASKLRMDTVMLYRLEKEATFAVAQPGMGATWKSIACISLCCQPMCA